MNLRKPTCPRAAAAVRQVTATRQRSSASSAKLTAQPPDQGPCGRPRPRPPGAPLGPGLTGDGLNDPEIETCMMPRSSLTNPRTSTAALACDRLPCITWVVPVIERRTLVAQRSRAPCRLEDGCVLTSAEKKRHRGRD